MPWRNSGYISRSEYARVTQSTKYAITWLRMSAKGVDIPNYVWIYLAYLHSYLSNRKQYVHINDITSDFETIISSVPQGSLVCPILFNCFFNDFCYVIEKASVHNFADDDTLSMFEETIQNFIALLETGSNTAIKWFQNNKMIVNPGKFQAIIIEEKKKCHTNETLKIGDKIINASSPVKLLGVQIDDKLNFNFHISNICRSAANQLNVLIRLKSFLAFEKRRPW